MNFRLYKILNTWGHYLPQSMRKATYEMAGGSSGGLRVEESRCLREIWTVHVKI